MANSKSKQIVLLHGWGSSVNKLAPLAKELTRLGWSVFVPELPGFNAPPPKSVWGVGDYADYVLKKSQDKFRNKKFFVFGHSFGGRITIKLAVGDNKNLSGVILCSTSGLSRNNPVKRGLFWILAKSGKALLVVPPVAKVWKKLLYKVAREHDYEKAKGTMREVFRKIVSEDLKPLVSRIKKPMLVLWGIEDRLTPVKDAHYIKRVLPTSELKIFDNEGHKLPYNKPEEVAERIDKWTMSLA